MALELLCRRMGEELESVNAALAQALKRLPEPCRPVVEHIMAAGGKRLRPFLAILCAAMLGEHSPRMRTLACAMEMLHAATLLHDDVLDEADTRRGRAAAHKAFSIKEAILAGDALLALGNAIIAEAGDPLLSVCYSNATIQTAAGEILEMNSLGNPRLPLETGLEIARGKTACLIGESCALGALAAKATPEQVRACRSYGENLGLAFQIVDDALDFSPQAQTGKPRGGDLREGKLTQPLRLYRESLSPSAREHFDAKFAKGDFSAAEADALSEKIMPFAQKSLELAETCLERARAALAALPAGEDRDILLEMADYVRQRRS